MNVVSKFITHDYKLMSTVVILSNIFEMVEMASIRSFIGIRIVELVYFSAVGLVGYWVFTFNFKFVLLSLLICLLQSQFRRGRSHFFIRLVTNTLDLFGYFQVARYYEEPVPEDEKTLFSFHPHAVYGFCTYL